MVPVSESLSVVCKEFIQVKNRLPVSKNDHFFITLNGNMCNAHTIRGWFIHILLKAGIVYGGRGKGPRLHDLRHTFAVHSLAMMAESGIDLYASLPVLSTYLGHTRLESTDQYVRLTSEMYPELLKDVDIITMNVFPEIKTDENN
jgi:integrase